MNESKEPGSRPEPSPDRSDRRERPMKRRYTPPELVEYGPVGKLTRGGSFTGGDAMAMMMLACL